jgi:hypothetical protein
MNEEQLNEYILLRQSGELSESQLQDLEQALAVDSAAAERANAYDLLFTAASDCPPAPKVSDLTLERILREGKMVQAANAAPTTAKAPFNRAWLSIAAVLLVALGIGAVANYRHLQQNPGSVAEHKPETAVQPQAHAEVAVALLENEVVDEALESLNEELAYVNEALFGDNFWGDASFTSSTSSEKDVDAIAAELLELEERML